jgi:diguanylate cyclase (GGDEF)-like protein
VLRNVARVIGEHIRPRDVACRYGGEEFAILLLDTNEHMARAVSRRLHQAIRSAAVLIGTTEVSVSVSIGFAIAAPDAEPDLDGLVKRADLALYVAKQGGRDQVKTWNLDAAARHQARGERG